MIASRRAGSSRGLRSGAGALAAIALAVACGLAAGYLFLQRDDAATLERANELGTERRYAAALEEARRVSRAPASDRAPLVEAYALAGLRRLEESAQAFSRAARRDPRNWVIYRDWARVQLALGRPGAAGRTMAKAQALNPRMTLPAGFHAAPRVRR